VKALFTIGIFAIAILLLGCAEGKQDAQAFARDQQIAKRPPPPPRQYTPHETSARDWGFGHSTRP
jgi:hypothetical protein